MLDYGELWWVMRGYGGLWSVMMGYGRIMRSYGGL